MRHGSSDRKLFEGEFEGCLLRASNVTREFKIAAVNRLQAGEPVWRLARELEVNPNQLHA
ncbi:MAG: transposase [Bacteroidetes bacterium]|nr:transposase [Bacteroidota bacterium]